MRHKKRIRSVCLALSLVIGMSGCGVQKEERVANSNQESTQESDVEASKEEAIRAQDDFYGYMNKEKLSTYALHYTDQMLGAAKDIQNQVEEEIYVMIQEIVNSKEAFVLGSDEQIIKDAYEQIKTYLENKESSAKDTYLQLAKQIMDAKNMDEIKNNFSQLRQRGITSYWNISVNDNYLDGTNHALFLDQQTEYCGVKLEDIYKKDDVRKQLLAYMTEALVTTGVAPKEAAKQAKAFVYFMIDLSCDTDFSIQEAVSPLATIREVKNEDLNSILEGMKIEDVEAIYDIDNPYGAWLIQDEEQLAFLSKSFQEENLDNLKLYMLGDLLFAYKDYLKEDYPFLDAGGTKKKDYDQEAAYMVANLFHDEVSDLYVKYYYTEEMDQVIQKMFCDIVDSYDDLITNADWLTKETRKQLLAKLHNMHFVAGTGTPHEIRKEDANVIGKDAFETMVNVKKREVQRDMEILGKPIDKTQNNMLSMEVNAAYSPCNTFTITVAIMHAPYFDVHADYASNMGGLGVVMGHEMGHAFDSNCIVFDENGKYAPEKICQEDQALLKTRLQQMENYYSGMTIMDIYHVNGAKTSGENYADIGAVESVMNVFRNDKESQKKAIENYARIWCTLEESGMALDLLQNDEHSPDVVRVNAVLSSIKEFYEIYDVKPGDGMYVAPEQRVSRWE
ncbi:MAG: M13 family metallopeptidase [Eubacteriales bacterium]|nr:M13 family metallopeptidase [Eubacteriales bacterium]